LFLRQQHPLLSPLRQEAPLSVVPPSRLDRFEEVRRVLVEVAVVVIFSIECENHWIISLSLVPKHAISDWCRLNDTHVIFGRLSSSTSSTIDGLMELFASMIQSLLRRFAL
jgi:hypothetical protein